MRAGHQHRNAVAITGANPLLHVGQAELERPLTADGVGDAHPELEQRGGAERVGEAPGALLVHSVHVAVAVIGAQGQRDDGAIDLVVLPVAVT